MSETAGPAVHAGAGLAGLLATAVQRHRLYPAASPLCAEAVAGVISHLARLQGEAVEIRVEPEGIVCDGERPSGGALVRELGERLFRADIALLSLRSDVTPAELGRFCRIVGHWDRRGDRAGSIADRVIDEGAVGVQVKMVERIAVIGTETLTSHDLRALEHDRSARAPEEGTASESLGFVRVDTEFPDAPLDLVDLACLHEDPGDLAVALEHVLEGHLESVDRDRALAERMGDLIGLYGRLGPDTGAARMDALARAVLALPEETRARLLGEKLLPELLETGRSAPLFRSLPTEILKAVLTDGASRGFGVRGIVELVLARLDLPESRRDALRRELGVSPSTPSSDEGAGPPTSRIAVGTGGPAEESLARYAALDLALDEEANTELERIRDAASREEGELRLRLLVDLVPLVRNADVLAEVVESAGSLLGDLVRARPRAATPWIREWVVRADSLREAFPEAAAVMDRTLCPLLAPDELRARAADLGEDAELSELVLSFGPHAAGAFVEALEAEDVRATRRMLSDFMCAHADRLADGLVAYVGDPRWMVRRNVARTLGFAGPSYTPFLRTMLETDEDRVAREVLLALARIGTDEAAEVVAEIMRGTDAALAAMAADSLKRFPRGLARARARQLLSDPGVCARHPGPAAELMRRLLRRDAGSVELLTRLAGLRFRLWRPGSARLGWTAWRVLRTAGGRTR